MTLFTVLETALRRSEGRERGEVLANIVRWKQWMQQFVHVAWLCDTLAHVSESGRRDWQIARPKYIRQRFCYLA